MFDTQDLEGLLQLFSFTKKRELKRYCKNLVIYSDDFAEMIFRGRIGLLAPYEYTNHIGEYVPEHLLPDNEEVEAAGRAIAGPLERKSMKFFKKTSQIFKERRLLTVHLFYTPSHKYWHLFYFDQRDMDKVNNHWMHGPHIHIFNYMFVNKNLKEVWEKILSGRTKFSNALHLRYEN